MNFGCVEKLRLRLARRMRAYQRKILATATANFEGTESRQMVGLTWELQLALMKNYVEALELSKIATTQPHAAHAAFTHGLSNK